MVDITAPNRLKSSFPLRKYGTAIFELNSDSSFTYTLEINRDVVLEKEVLGNPVSKTLIKAVYKNFQKGKFIASDSSLILYDSHNNEISQDKYYFKERILYTEFVSKDRLTWLIAWEKN
ncbi:MAG: hypothetical protein HF314_04810 [Ignavibacteria bacterium]|nr:hypothetical protein [Ignavibacteria bacterium]MCU7502371.1 hypothetical protein [Ignavibacteria bacterium]MCU7515064.1 hypothetical protein [Ignavibacteria bacterium]